MQSMNGRYSLRCRLLLLSSVILFAAGGCQKRPSLIEHAPVEDSKLPAVSSGARPEVATDLRIRATVKGTTVIVTLINVGNSPLRVMSHMKAAELQYDWFRLELTSSEGIKHTVELVTDRDKAFPVEATLEAGGELSHPIDVLVWAKRGNKPTPSGTYALNAIYDTSSSSSPFRPEGAKPWFGRIVSPEARLIVP